ncbi:MULTISPECIES: glutathione S-transferase N-terminal domain-containing protein [unclassified Agarivorans]|uniref:glutathione S-transferase N-terminal domain-containing protein n=1 Tax=unclassified Agarivorans TaxID=2636026 RepID=UPI0026E3A7F9|nr:MULTISPECIES: glutathione S-transferase N-terminal domain-containing protein [unclassified Agarivorans]MDO6685516.1 glutathione S-transferase N-terminal domain-containing protein [Agarivorans sp. 3_MG-2023]MDO6715902.1 glutathione S-transferase N-terminal domain-containing protein [Agarivorans sp. 2_MG-2023]
MSNTLKLVVGRDSTWSIRAYLSMQLAELELELTTVPLGEKGYRQTLSTLSPTGLVPVLQHGDLLLHDSLAISEYANELSPGTVLPVDKSKRALARSYLAELHSGFINIRTQLPFQFKQVDRPSINADLQIELQRLSTIWQSFDGCFAFGQASVVDAFYAVMAVRLFNYGIELDDAAGRYQHHLMAWPLFKHTLKEAENW